MLLLNVRSRTLWICLTIKKKKICVCCRVGCQRSSLAAEVYAKRAAINKTIVQAGFGYVIIANAFAHGFPALCPLMYWLFGAPTPDKWYQPVQVNKA